MPTISVVIATHNRASLLEATLAQLRQQHFGPADELVVVDNGSTDGTREVIARAEADFPVRLRHLRELTPGKTPALNAGLQAARGDILALTDDDVLVADDWLPAIRQAFEDPELALAGGRVDPMWERPAPRWLRIEDGPGFGTMASPLALLHYGDRQALGPRTAVGANLAVRRSALQQIGAFAPHLGRRRGTLLGGEDHEFCQRLVAAGCRCEYRPEIRVRHWVPAERERLPYYLRWFFWSGLTNALLEDPLGATRRTLRSRVPPYIVRQLVSEALSAVGQLVAGRYDLAASRAMNASFALGFITYGITGRPRSDALLRQAQTRPTAAVSATQE